MVSDRTPVRWGLFFIAAGHVPLKNIQILSFQAIVRGVPICGHLTISFLSVSVV